MLRHYNAASCAAANIAAATAAAANAAAGSASAASATSSAGSVTADLSSAPRHFNSHPRRASSLLPPHAVWTLKDTRDVFPAVGQVRPMSARVLAVGVMLAGVLVLAVALIMGLEFPKYVHNQLLDDQCVVHTQHARYPSWVDGSQWTRQVRLYFHHLVNGHDVLYHGAVPEFQEKGPYLYQEYEVRTDVEFLVPEVQYRLQRLHVFDPQRTREECPACDEYDNITLLNTGYLRHMFNTGGLENYLLSALAPFMQNLMARWGLNSGPSEKPAWAQNVSLLGCLQSCDSLDALLDVNASFGRWLRTSLTAGKTYAWEIVTSRGNASFSATETAGIYGAVVNSTLLGSGVFSAWAQPAGSVWHERCRTWAGSVCKGLAAVPDPGLCGLVHFLQSCQAVDILRDPYAKGNFTSFFCADQSSSASSSTSLATSSSSSTSSFSSSTEFCLSLSSLPDSVVSAYFEAFRDFILLHLLGLVHDSVVMQRDQDLVVTRPQRHLALGFYVTDAWQSSVDVPGVLEEAWLTTSAGRGVLWTVETCLLDRTLDSNMRLTEFNGSHHAPQWLVRDGTDPATLSLSGGYTDFFPACTPATCTTCFSPGPTLQVFHPLLSRNILYGQPQAVSMWDATVHRYQLSPEEFQYSSHYRVNCGLQHASGTLGYNGWVSLPRLGQDLLHNVSLDKRNCSPLPTAHSFIDVEAISGRLWQSQTQYQLNGGISASDVTGPRGRPLNVTYLNKAFPVVWVERLVQLSLSEREYYYHKVQRLMKVSCGGLISLSIIAVVVIGLGVAILLQPKKNNRVAPQLDPETSASNAHPSLRHHNNT